MNGTQTIKEFLPRNNNKVRAPTCETLKDEYPIVGRGLGQFLPVDGPPATRSKLFLELPPHVRHEEERLERLFSRTMVHEALLMEPLVRSLLAYQLKLRPLPERPQVWRRLIQNYEVREV